MKFPVIFIIYKFNIEINFLNIVEGIMKKLYDYFISYKSEDTNIVRIIAEQMMASGLKIWFAEYNIIFSGRSGIALKNNLDELSL